MKKILVASMLTAAVSSTAMAFTVEGTGSSFQYPANKAWAKMYFDKTGNKINYTATGSGTGIKSVTARQVDFGGSDKPLTPKVLKKKNLSQLPIAIGAIVFGYNIPGVNDLKLSERAISGIMLGNLEYWDAATIKTDNPSAKLPHEKILFVHRSDKSGTTFGFTYYLSKMNSVWRTHFGAKKSLNWPTPNTIAGKGNFGVSTAIKTNNYSIGYVDFADAKSNKLNMATIENKAHKFVEATAKSFGEGAKYADLNPKKDFYANIQYPKSGYPIMAATFVLVPNESKNKSKVADFYRFSLAHPKVVSNLGYVALPPSVVSKVEKYMDNKGMK